MTDEAPGAGGDRRLTTREAAELLGVKPETVYAYVSRGRLGSRRAPGGRGSTFDAGEVAALARRTGPARPVQRTGTDLSVRTALTLIEADRYYYRGVDAAELARDRTYEEVAEWLWTGRLRPGAAFTAPRAAARAARAAVRAMPELSGTTDLLRVAASAAGAVDPLRFDLSGEAVLATGRGLIPTLVAALPPAGPDQRGEGPLARRLWSRLTPHPADDGSLRVLDTALALLVDHDLATSTLAVRVAASARAHVYAAVSTGLGVLDAPLHGAASGQAHRMLLNVLDEGNAAPVVAEELRAGRRIPGLGHRVYRGEDPRARVLFALLEQLPQADSSLAAARDIVRTAARHTGLHANVDLALAVFTTACGMPPTAGETVFALARTAGWIAHALEEYAEAPLRMRPLGDYTGPTPPQPLPAPATD
ncbi:citrate/2-methylcitrate synthase [Streptomyces sp. NPDC050560]|uniref:citrate/2-methylcitrate synthase n=1 Tax=Streptomyces sp. NPDC050560 TaxID=3365630 RepID=UPI0037944526